uniref:MPN domain-containing protein n=1 Tax=Strombidium rassoulzadegani TaxID=1082188 RepID=A0A7S3CIW4_9SPIT|mmetsp:Transcript_10069/g.16978  ORF Transcript_10069/g.16978 Transcript_10069/m.16978 type:complete len:254 (+) Transcript_10069:161-922(+)
MGEYGDKGVLEVTNCYAVPFEEDKNEPNIWFFDHIYHEQMFNMMRKINSREKIIGWYSTGPDIKRNDIEINEILRRYNTNPAFVVIKVQDEKQISLPTEAYFSQEETDDNGKIQRQFVHVPSTFGATEAEEVGVEHLLRDIKDAGQGQLSRQVIDKINGLSALAGKLGEMRLYLENVISGKYKYNHQIIQNFQDIFNLLPNFQQENMIQQFQVKSNDYMYVLYVTSLIKSVISLHTLINNKIHNKETQQAKLD